MSYEYNVDPSCGGYTCEEGVTTADICAHFQITEDELCECNHGCVPDCSCGTVIYLPEKCWKTESSKVCYSHHEEDTNYSSEQCAANQHVGGGSCDPCDPCYGGDQDASHQHSKVNYSHHESDTNYSSEQASSEAHVGGQTITLPGVPGGHGYSSGGHGGY